MIRIIMNNEEYASKHDDILETLYDKIKKVFPNIDKIDVITQGSSIVEKGYIYLINEDKFSNGFNFSNLMLEHFKPNSSIGKK